MPPPAEVFFRGLDPSAAWSIAAAEVFFYGSYLVMFGFYLHVLRTHGIAQHRFLAASTISLFILGTAHCALQLAATIFHVRLLMETTGANTNFEVYLSLTEAASGIYVRSTVIADSIIIFRCYAIWGCRRKIVIFPIILTLAVAGLGYSNIKINLETNFAGGGILLFIASIATSLLTTLVLTGLTANLVRILALTSSSLESGALYCIGGIGFLAMGSNKIADIILSRAASPNFISSRAVPPDFIFSGAVLAQLVGIAPTIIAVRVGLGYSVENVGTFTAAAPRTRPPPQVIPGTPSVESLDDQVLYIHAEGRKVEGV
ncbi:hypothetical protein C8R44DRAFT_974323 [Mycena epipterygia]|nr:hypothetical protein C8R44DRAFT_974323 [Mycena epipterygia]